MLDDAWNHQGFFYREHPRLAGSSSIGKGRVARLGKDVAARGMAAV